MQVSLVLNTLLSVFKIYKSLVLLYYSNVTGVIDKTVCVMFYGAAISIVREHRADYGLQKIYGIFASLVSPVLAGSLIDYASRDKDYMDFRLVFYQHGVLKIFSGLLMLLINLEFKEPAQRIIKNVVSTIRNIEVTFLVTVCLMVGKFFNTQLVHQTNSALLIEYYYY